MSSSSPEPEVTRPAPPLGALCHSCTATASSASLRRRYGCLLADHHWPALRHDGVERHGSALAHVDRQRARRGGVRGRAGAGEPGDGPGHGELRRRRVGGRGPGRGVGRRGLWRVAGPRGPRARPRPAALRGPPAARPPRHHRRRGPPHRQAAARVRRAARPRPRVARVPRLPRGGLRGARAALWRRPGPRAATGVPRSRTYLGGATTRGHERRRPRRSPSCAASPSASAAS